MADGHAIIIKKVKKGGGDGHHGGAWKVAYADFVTAMMAFFLLMWLLGATTEDQRKGIADYFNPTIPMSQVSGGGKDALFGETVFSEQTLARDGAGGERTPLDQAPDGEEVMRVEVQQVDIEDENGAGASALGGDDLQSNQGKDEQRLNQEQQKRLQQALAAQAGADGAHILTRITSRGLVIELVDTDGHPLFQSGSANPSDTMLRLLQVVATTVGYVTNKVEIVGHTDSSGFTSGANYSNWELSVDRANIARRLLVVAGMDTDQISAISGKADTEPLTDDPTAPQNRRISITLLKH